ncbi:MAG: OmpH family outer membrane protein [Bacteroidetes bacterium]|nr:OmpH family outer membrane protein [Bacteroidota bacterium]MBU1718629.1 OmpH family outer membrane protein [Bacteroidota bacterium]
MKKIILIPALILFFGVAFAQKIGYVDTKYILENIPEYNAAQDQLDEQAIEWQKEIEAKFQEIDKLYKAFQAEHVLLPEDMKKKREEEIINKEKETKELQKKRFGSNGDLFTKRQELIKPVQDKVFAAINDIATKGNYQVIFDKSSDLIMLYTNPKLDLSDEVLAKLGYTPGGHSIDNGEKDDNE